MVGCIQERERWEVASSKYDDVWLDDGFVDAVRLWTAIVREVCYAVLGDVRRSRCNFDYARDGRDVGVKEEATNASRERPLCWPPGSRDMIADALPGFIEED